VLSPVKTGMEGSRVGDARTDGRVQCYKRAHRVNVLSPARGEGVRVCLRGVPEVVVCAAVCQIIERVEMLSPVLCVRSSSE
jgi:hypothetical protein